MARTPRSAVPGRAHGGYSGSAAVTVPAAAMATPRSMPAVSGRRKRTARCQRCQLKRRSLTWLSSGGEGSSSAAALPAPKEEPAAEENAAMAVAGAEEAALSTLDFVRDDDLERVTAQLLKQSASKAAEEERRRKDELDKLLLQQGVAAEHDHLHRTEEWKRIAEEQSLLYVGLDTSSDEE